MVSSRKNTPKITPPAGLEKRWAEFLSSAGVHKERIALEVLYLLPPEFVRGYTDLFHRALNTSEDGIGTRNDSAAELGKAKGSAAKKQKGSRGIFTIRNDRALGEKDRIDRALRRLARQMRDGGGADTGKDSVSRCMEDFRGELQGPDGGCGRWVETGWRFCPNCGRKQP